MVATATIIQPGCGAGDDDPFIVFVFVIVIVILSFFHSSFNSTKYEVGSRNNNKNNMVVQQAVLRRLLIDEMKIRCSQHAFRKAKRLVYVKS